MARSRSHGPAGEPEIQDRVEQYLRTLARGKPITVRVLRGGVVLTLEGVTGS